MPEKIIGVYAGSFDPPTVGHESAIRLCARISDKLIVAVGVNPDKSPLFTAGERVAMLKDMTADMPNVEVRQFTIELLVDFARAMGANCLFRGIRNSDDFKFENAIWHFNHDRAPDIMTWWLPSELELADVSSSFVKGFVGTLGWEDTVRKYLPKEVFERFVQKSRDRLAHRTIEHMKDLPTVVMDALPGIVERALPDIVKRLLPQIPNLLMGRPKGGSKKKK